jgi:hypothetical protein
MVARPLKQGEALVFSKPHGYRPVRVARQRVVQTCESHLVTGEEPSRSFCPGAKTHHQALGLKNPKRQKEGPVERAPCGHPLNTHAGSSTTLVFDMRAIQFFIDYTGPKQLPVGTDYPLLQRETPVAQDT